MALTSPTNLSLFHDGKSKREAHLERVHLNCSSIQNESHLTVICSCDNPTYDPESQLKM